MHSQCVIIVGMTWGGRMVGGVGFGCWCKSSVIDSTGDMNISNAIMSKIKIWLQIASNKLKINIKIKYIDSLLFYYILIVIIYIILSVIVLCEHCV